MAASDKETERYTLVVGLGASGAAAARYLADRGESVLVIDSRENPPGLSALRDDHPEIECVASSLDSRWLEHADRVVLSPGLSAELPLIEQARARNLQVLGELELFAQAVKQPVLAVTGSNGKSTVTTLTATMLEAQGFRAPAGGNLGPPAVELLRHEDADAFVIEVSSFQLETTTSLKPAAAALLNISPDHIDRHGSLERYAALKASLLMMADRAVVNWDDPLVRALAPRRENTIVWSVREPLSSGWSIVEAGGDRWIARDMERLRSVADVRLRGEIAEANALASLALAECLGGDMQAALDALASFTGLPHRLQLAGEHQGVRYINDSKGTNVGATVAALADDDAPTLLIAGGQAKGADFGPLAAAVEGRVKAAILIGEAREQLEQSLAGHTRTVLAESMEQAVALAASEALPGDRVLLSPACASQDMFRDYAHRGSAFVAAVEALQR